MGLPAVLAAPAVPHILVLLIVVRQRADAAAVGLILARALVSKPHHKDATMCQLQVAEADFIGTLLLALAVRAVRLRRQAAALHQPQLHPAQVAAHVRQDIIGCLIMADGVCLTAQAQAADLHQQLHLLLLQLLPVNLLRLKQQVQLHLLQPNQAPLLRQQVNPHQLLAPKDDDDTIHPNPVTTYHAPSFKIITLYLNASVKQSA